MNSSTSSSEAGWARFAAAFLAAAALLCLGLLATVFLLDPYDSGRSPLTLKPGVRPQGPRMAAASRGRDLAFQAAIFGNSHIQLISPEALKSQSGIAFVSLATPGTGPKETLALLDWFLRHRREPARAVVVGIDELWCTPDPAMPNARPFPFWLYGRSRADYAVGLLRLDVVQELPQRLAYLRDARAERARPDGYWDYESNFGGQDAAAERERRAILANRLALGGGNAGGPFPAAAALEAMLAGSPQTALILLRPPSYVTSLPMPASPDAAADAACRNAFAALAARRPRSALVDWRIDRPENRAPENFFDHTHYRRALAALVEADVAARLNGLR